MKKLFIILVLFIFCKPSFAQYPLIQNIGNDSILVRVGQTHNGGIWGNLINNVYSDTTSANLTRIPFYVGAQIWSQSDSSLYIRQKSAYGGFWVKVAGSGGGATGFFYNLTGNYLAVTPAGLGVGFNDPYNVLNFKTNNTVRLTIPVAGISNSSGATDSVLLTKSDGVTMGKISKTDLVGAAGWTLTGNTGTTPGTNFLGTTDATGLMFKLNSVQWGYLDYTNNSASFGFQSLLNNAGQLNNAFGWKALTNNTSGVNNSAFGSLASLRNTTGGYNAAFGYQALDSNQTGTGSVAVGYRALFRNRTDQNTAIGYNALSQITTESGNTAVGATAGQNLVTGTGNTAIGASALGGTSPTGIYNTVIGYTSGSALTTGHSNTGIGVTSLVNTTTGFQNFAGGAGALETNTTGTGNTASGYDAGLNNTTGNYNTWTGWNAKSSSNGVGNAIFGYNAGGTLTAGNSYNTFMGYYSGNNASQKVDATNSIAIGNGTWTVADSEAIIGTAAGTKQTRLNGLVYFNDATGTGLQSIRVNAGATALEYYTPSTVATAVPWDGVTASTADNTINNGAFTKTMTYNTLAGASALKLSSTSTVAASNSQKLFEAALTGANGTSSQSTYSGYFSNDHSGTTSTNYSVYGISGTSTTAYGVYGQGGGTSTTAYGVYGRGAGGSATNNYGLYGLADGNGATNSYGIYADANHATTNTGGYFTASTGTTNNAINIGAGALALNGSAGTSGQVLTSAGANTLPTWSTPTTGTVTSIATTSPITGGTITTTGTIACATCVVASSPGVGIAHFAGSTQTVTSSAVALGGADVSGTLTYDKGGTGQSSYTKGDIIYASANNVLSKLAIGTTKQTLHVVSGVPAWVDTTAAGGGSGITIGTTTITSGTDTKILYDNAGVVGEYTVGTGVATALGTATTAQGGLVTRTYKVYTALLTQSGTNAPVATILENTIGSIVWARTGAGQYTATLSSAFTSNKTWLEWAPTFFEGAYTADFGITSTSVLNLNIAGGDDFLAIFPIEIRVYY